jgi:peptidoglycan/LPS O-acetylase OafA/YrhL
MSRKSQPILDSGDSPGDENHPTAKSPKITEVPSQTAPGVELVDGARRRFPELDRLKIGFIGGIIVAHGVIGYTDFGSWPYQEVRETSLSSITEALLVPIVSIGGLFLMGLFFFISGLLTPGAVTRKGARRFVIDRLWRLGVPFGAFTLVLWPLTMYAVREPFEHRGSVWWWFIHEKPILDNGPIWFLGVLLIFSIGYAAWRAWRPEVAHRPSDADRPPARVLLRLGFAIVLFTFLVRLEFAVDTGQVANLHLWQWPGYLGMFGLGVVCAQRGWLMPVPSRLRKTCGVVALVAVMVLPALIFSAESLGLTEDDYFGGFGWPAAATAVVEGALTVAGCLWVLGFAQRRLSTPPRPWIARSAYAAFLVQGPVLIGLAIALRTTPVPGDAKAIIVAAGGLAGSFLLARPLVERTPLGRIL